MPTEGSGEKRQHNPPRPYRPVSMPGVSASCFIVLGVANRYFFCFCVNFYSPFVAQKGTKRPAHGAYQSLSPLLALFQWIETSLVRSSLVIKGYSSQFRGSGSVRYCVVSKITAYRTMSSPVSSTSPAFNCVTYGAGFF